MVSPPDEQLDLFAEDDGQNPPPPREAKVPASKPRVENKRKPAPSPPTSQHAEKPVSENDKISRHFLGWDRPLLTLATEYLFPPGASNDLSDTLVIVPTRGARRRLKSALYQRATADGSTLGLLPPEILSPSTLLALANDPNGKPAAVETVRAAAWIQVLRSTDPASLPDLFPVARDLAEPSFASHLASEFISLSSALGEGGIAFGGVNEATEEAHETSRWEDLTRIENTYLNTLDKHGFSDPDALRRTGLEKLEVPHGIRKIIVIGLSDPPALALRILQKFSTQIAVEICIFAPVDSRERFDLWGRPLTDDWGDVTQHQIPIQPEQLHLLRSPTEQAQVTTALLQDAKVGEIALGLCDPELASPLRLQLESNDIPVYDPEGRPASSSTAAQALAHLPEILRSGSFAAIARLFREPDALRALSLAADCPENELLHSLDKLQEESVPATLKDAVGLARGKKVAPAIRRLEEVTECFIEKPLPQALRDFLKLLFGGKKLEPSDAADLANKDFITHALAAAEALHSGGFDLGSGAGGASAELDLILRVAGRAQSYSPSRPAGTTELTGWLEVFWDAAPHAVILGANEGSLPASMAGDAFLPDSLRAELGLRCNATRIARDAYLLTALLASRAETGKVDILLGKENASDDPIRPSRLLLLCPDPELPKRVAQLFGPADVPHGEGSKGHPWQAAWKLKPQILGDPAEGHRHSPIEKMAPTAFRSYLACPFLFYLQRGLRMKEVDPEPGELTANGFGNLAHDALEAFAKNTGLRDSTDAEAISAFLEAELERRARGRFGNDPPLPVIIQIDSLKKRLRRAALVQAAHREEGWKIKGDPELEIKWEINGMPVSGKVDRIDEHENSGEILVIDYKTSARGSKPWESHWKNSKASIPEDDLWRHYPDEGKNGVDWIDLQLPLYASEIAKKFERPQSEVTVAYFNLPLAISGTQLIPWPLPKPAMESALDCAEEIVKRVQAGNFWPPRATNPPQFGGTKLYAFERIFPRGVESQIDPSLLLDQPTADSDA